MTIRLELQYTKVSKCVGKTNFRVAQNAFWAKFQCQRCGRFVCEWQRGEKPMCHADRRHCLTCFETIQAEELKAFRTLSLEDPDTTKRQKTSTDDFNND